MKALVVRGENKDNLTKFLAGEIKEIELHAESNPETDIPVKTCILFIGVSKPDTGLLVTAKLDGKKITHLLTPSIEQDQEDKSVTLRAGNEKTNTAYIKKFIKANSLTTIGGYCYVVNEYFKLVDGQLIRILAAVFNKATYMQIIGSGGYYGELDFGQSDKTILSEQLIDASGYLSNDGYSHLEVNIIFSMLATLVDINLANKHKAEKLKLPTQGELLHD